MCMTTAWLSKNGSGMLTGSQPVAEADGNALHTCMKQFLCAFGGSWLHVATLHRLLFTTVCMLWTHGAL